MTYKVNNKNSKKQIPQTAFNSLWCPFDILCHQTEKQNYYEQKHHRVFLARASPIRAKAGDTSFGSTIQLITNSLSLFKAI